MLNETFPTEVKTMKLNSPAVIVLSGGQDSTTCLGVAIANGYPDIHAIGFDYGQKHRVELECAMELCAKHDIPFRVVGLSFLPNLVTSALTGQGEVGQPHAYKPGLPSSFVPSRNALFLTLAHAYAQELGAGTIITGVCQTDFSGYPDCRDHFVKTLALALNFGYETDIDIRTPLMHLTKAETFALAQEAGFLTEVLALSHTCYNGDHETLHDWGYGCGNCPACELRAKGWEAYLAGDFRLDGVETALRG